MGVYAKDTCLIPAGMGKYIPVQTSRDKKGEVIIETRDKTIPGLVLPDIVYSVKKKLRCIFMENHNLEPKLLKRGQTIEVVTSYVVVKEEKGQTPVECSDATQSVTGRSNAKDNCIGGTSGRREEKAGQIADSVQSIENRNFYETEEEKHQFMRERFKLHENKILNADEKL